MLSNSWNAAFGATFDGPIKTAWKKNALKQSLELEGLEKAYPNELRVCAAELGLARGLAVDLISCSWMRHFRRLIRLSRQRCGMNCWKLQDRHERTIIFYLPWFRRSVRIGDRIAIMQGGRVIQVEDAWRDPAKSANDYVRAFFRAVWIQPVFSRWGYCRDSQPMVVWHTAKTGSPRATLEMLSIKDREGAYAILTQNTAFCGLFRLCATLLTKKWC